MKVSEAITKRRAYRSLEKIEITDKLIEDLLYHASLAPSCYNKQPWHFIFIKSPENLKKIFEALPEGNSWAKKTSMIIAVYSKKEDDCVIGEREYYLFDTGIAVGFLILRATELNLVAHPIAGYDVNLLKKTLNLENNINLINLIVIGKHSDKIDDSLSDWQKQQEKQRPIRKKFDDIASLI